MIERRGTQQEILQHLYQFLAATPMLQVNYSVYSHAHPYTKSTRPPGTALPFVSIGQWPRSIGDKIHQNQLPMHAARISFVYNSSMLQVQ